jgi:hypothetical protein
VKYHKLVIIGALAFAGCAAVSVTSPDGKSSASYRGTSIIGGEEVSCGELASVITCSVSGQNVAELAQAVAPYLAGAGGIPLPAPSANPTSKQAR